MIPLDEFAKLGRAADESTREQVDLGKYLAFERELFIRVAGEDPRSAYGRYIEFMIGFSIGFEAASSAIAMMAGDPRLARAVGREHFEMIGEIFSRERVPGIEEPWRCGYRYALDRHFTAR